MEKTKLKRIMSESVFVRETALESFENKLQSKSFSEATKIIKSLGAESFSDLKEQVMEGTIKAEALDVPADKKDDSKEDDSKKEAADEEDDDSKDSKDDKVMEKLINVMESLSSRIEALEDNKDSDEEDDKKSEAAEADANDDETSGDDITKKQVDPDTGKLPTKGGDKIVNGDGPKAGKMESAESDDADGDKKEDDKQPKPPVVKESLGTGYTTGVQQESISQSSNRFDNVFKF